MKTYFFTLLVLISFVTAFGQQTSKKERIQALKIAFMTERIDLSAKEAQQFWPAYNDFEERLSTIHSEERKTFKFIRENIDAMDEAMAKTAFEKLEDFEENKVDAREKLLDKLKNVLSYKKTLIFIKAEGDFKRNLLQTLRGGRRN
ncbi:hypothetical protein [Dokdonia sp. Hel_I_53]|uniref:hypothetical protein n=1 Tax=Dokdonia sp. Hel_I_53 TaxID=1566287 RepID=UPI00119C8FD3|nr:hypothetical protein [Dokdonia sp. Hel_I_53]TVZ51443.1 hypothetical protein OD90_0586 [Dokdonia sp. Hel_I_53]